MKRDPFKPSDAKRVGVRKLGFARKSALSRARTEFMTVEPKGERRHMDSSRERYGASNARAALAALTRGVSSPTRG